MSVLKGRGWFRLVPNLAYSIARLAQFVFTVQAWPLLVPGNNLCQ